MSEGPPLEDRAGLGGARLAEVAAEVAPHATLESVVRWGLSRDPAALIEDVVVQDEYTHDVVVSYGRGLWLVYDTT